ncbi:MAG: 23S rRNA (pseudouridine(1915)-N(3))-methyltransferase RlmH [Saprospiraceae bacterium]
MKINFIWIGKPKYKHTAEAVDMYISRLRHYTKVEIIQLRDVRFISPKKQKVEEAKLFQKYLKSDAFNVCLDEHGKAFTSMQLSQKITSFQNMSIQCLNIMIGGAYGFDKSVLNQSNEKWSLSKMTLPHDLCRIILTEQLYRAFTIIRNEKYHNP